MSDADAQWRFLADRYELLGRLGAGAVGAVWLVRDRHGGAEYAIKILRPELTASPEACEQLRTVLATVRALGHPGVVAVDDVVEHEGRVALVMRPVPGEDLRVLLARMGRLAAAHAALLLAQLCDALAAAHAAGVAHGGVKPANVLLEPLQDEAGSLRLGLTDFGAAPLAASAGVTALQDEIGAAFYQAMPVEYQAPEIGVGRVADPAADVYAVGVLLYEALAGRPPFTGAFEEVQWQHRAAQPPRIPGLPDPYWLAIAACLDKQAQHRPTAAELAGLLREISPAAEAAAQAPAREQMEQTVPVLLPVPIAAADDADLPPSAVRSRFTAPRRAEVAAVAAVIVLAFAATWLFTSGGPGPGPAAGLAAAPSAQPSDTASTLADGGAFGAGGTASASPSATATASSRPSASPSPSPSASPAASAGASARASASPSPTAAPVTVSWQCSTDTVRRSDIVKTSCIGLGSDGALYLKGAFTAPGQNITDIELTLVGFTGGWGGSAYATATGRCAGSSCQLASGPYKPPPGRYTDLAGMDHNAHNESSPAVGYRG